LCKVFIEFILLMDRITCWYNTALQVLANAPALHSLIIRERADVADILALLNHVNGDLRRLILQQCWFVENSTGFLANIVASCPDLEGLSLENCYPLTSDGIRLIPCLKNLSELNLSTEEVHYVCDKFLREACLHMCECSQIYVMLFQLMTIAHYYTSFNETFLLAKSAVNVQVSLKSDNNNRYCTWRAIYSFDHISLSSCYNEKCFRQSCKKIKTHILLAVTLFDVITSLVSMRWSSLAEQMWRHA
jgi:hypothetical protein